MVVDKLGQYIVAGDIVVTVCTYFIKDIENFKTETRLELAKVINVYDYYDHIDIETDDDTYTYEACKVVVVTQQLEQ